MSGGDKKLQPIIVKKIKKGGHGHHGGAWKIAYADFVTAMMAFFLLMWLLGSTTSGDLKGISDVFNTPLKVAMAGGSGSGDSTSIIKGGGENLTRSVGQVKRGDNDPSERTNNPHALSKDSNRLKGEQRLKGLQEKVQSMISNDPSLSKLQGQIRMQMTAEGLRIQIVDDQKRAMFPSGKAVVEAHMRDLLRGIGGLLNEVRNPISISGHTDSLPFAAGERTYSNWELSTDRANASRRELIAGGLSAKKVLRVVGMGPAMPLVPSDPRNPVNRRIAIVVLTEEAATRLVREPAAIDLGQTSLQRTVDDVKSPSSPTTLAPLNPPAQVMPNPQFAPQSAYPTSPAYGQAQRYIPPRPASGQVMGAGVPAYAQPRPVVANNAATSPSAASQPYPRAPTPVPQSMPAPGLPLPQAAAPAPRATAVEGGQP